MGTTRRRCVRDRVKDFTGGKREQFLSGHDFFSDGYGEGDAFDEEAARADWQRYGPILMEEWLAAFDKPVGKREHGFSYPKCDSLRPWAWWRFSCPEPRPDKAALSEFEFLEKHGLLEEGDATRRDLLAREQEIRREQDARFEERYQATRRAIVDD